MLAPSHAVSQSPSNGNYGVDSPLFSSDDLSGFHSVTDSNVVSDDSLLGNLSTNDDTTTLFAENIDDCASDDTIQPGRKIRARDDLLCPSGLGSNSPAIRLPSVGDVENVVKPDPDSFKPQEVWHRGLGYYSICPSQYKKLADWVVCGIQGTSIGQAMWEYDVYDADLCTSSIWFIPCSYCPWKPLKETNGWVKRCPADSFLRNHKVWDTTAAMVLREI